MINSVKKFESYLPTVLKCYNLCKTKIISENNNNKKRKKINEKSKKKSNKVA